MKSDAKILVIGDAMLDKHTRGAVNRISPEAPVPVIDAGAKSDFSLGAAANVACQIREAGFQVVFAYKEYEDLDGENTHETLELQCLERDIRPFPLFFPSVRHPVTTKERIWAESQQICRVDREDKRKPIPEIEEKWIGAVRGLLALAKADGHPFAGVVFSDYDKGTLTDKFIQAIADYCHANDIFTILDPKRYSFFGLQHLTVIKPNDREIALTNMESGDCSQELGNTILLNTRGKNGMTAYQRGAIIGHERAYTLPEDVVDVCGCGDTVTAFMAMGMASKWTLARCMHVASLAAAVNIKHNGCYVLDAEEIQSVFSLPMTP